MGKFREPRPHKGLHEFKGTQSNRNEKVRGRGHLESKHAREELGRLARGIENVRLEVAAMIRKGAREDDSRVVELRREIGRLKGLHALMVKRKSDFS